MWGTSQRNEVPGELPEQTYRTSGNAWSILGLPTGEEEEKGEYILSVHFCPVIFSLFVKDKKKKKSQSSVDSEKQTSIIFTKCVLTLLRRNLIQLWQKKKQKKLPPPYNYFLWKNFHFEEKIPFQRG